MIQTTVNKDTVASLFLMNQDVEQDVESVACIIKENSSRRILLPKGRSSCLRYVIIVLRKREPMRLTSVRSIPSCRGEKNTDAGGRRKRTAGYLSLLRKDGRLILKFTDQFGPEATCYCIIEIPRRTASLAGQLTDAIRLIDTNAGDEDGL